MTVAILSGASSGALHAVTGPDHLLSLGPAALRSPHSAGRIGLIWGLGHALGTVLLSLPLLLLAQLAELSFLAALGDRLAGLALLVTAALSWRSTRGAPGAAALEARSPLLVGLVHGITGAGALLLVLPNTLGASWLRSSLYLAAFAAGSTVAMALLTRAIGHAGRSLPAHWLRRIQVTLMAGAASLGSFWLVFG